MRHTARNLTAGLILTGLLSGHGSVYGATSGTVDLLATSQVVNAVSASTVATSVTSLGSSAQTDVKFGSISIDSNDGAGFSIVLSSDKGGEMVLLDKDGNFVSSPASSQKIGYTVKMTATGGTLGSGITAPASLSTAASLAANATYEFVGPANSGTTGYTLDLKFSTGVASIMGGDYKDVITVDIVEL